MFQSPWLNPQTLVIKYGDKGKVKSQKWLQDCKVSRHCVANLQRLKEEFLWDKMRVPVVKDMIKHSFQNSSAISCSFLCLML